jgi:DNA-binding transcriptional MerR regulator
MGERMPARFAGGVAMTFKALQVGDLAKRTGLTIRALDLYAAIGLVRPSLRTEARCRVYTAADISRLQRVLSLRQLGFSLGEIRACLDRPEFSPMEVSRLHLARVREQIQLQQNLCKQLEAIAVLFRTADEVSGDELLQTIGAIAMTEKYFTPQQPSLIDERRSEAGVELLHRRREAWAKLINATRAEMDAGTDPKNVRVQKLAKRWKAMSNGTTAGNPDMKQALKRLLEEQGNGLFVRHGAKYDPRPVFEYITTAIDALNHRQAK